MTKFKALHFEITHNCNLRCKHCYNIDYLKSSRPDLQTLEVKKVIDISQSVGCKDFGFSGGEPFVRKDFIEIIDYAPGPVHILTNGLLIDEIKAKKIKKLNKPIEFRVSLDGLESNAQIWGVNYKKVLNKIKLLLDFEFVVTVNTMITPYNHNDLLKMYALFKTLRIDRWRLDFIFQKGNACFLNLDKKKFEMPLNSIKKLIKKYIEERPSFEFDVNKFFRSFLLRKIKRTKYTVDSFPCSYQGALTVRPDGEISFCPSLDVTFGNILKKTPEEIFNNKNYLQIKNIRVKDIKDCDSCEILDICGGGCRADAYYSTGSLFKADKFTCEAMKFFYKEIYKKDFFKIAK